MIFIHLSTPSPPPIPTSKPADSGIFKVFECSDGELEYEQDVPGKNQSSNDWLYVKTFFQAKLSNRQRTARLFRNWRGKSESDAITKRRSPTRREPIGNGERKKMIFSWSNVMLMLVLLGKRCGNTSCPPCTKNVQWPPNHRSVKRASSRRFASNFGWTLQPSWICTSWLKRFVSFFPNTRTSAMRSTSSLEIAPNPRRDAEIELVPRCDLSLLDQSRWFWYLSHDECHAINYSDQSLLLTFASSWSSWCTRNVEIEWIWEIRSLKMQVHIHYPRTWNSIQDWFVDIVAQKPQVYFVFEHKNFLQGQYSFRSPTVSIWTSVRPPSDDQRLVFIDTIRHPLVHTVHLQFQTEWCTAGSAHSV